MPSFRNFTGSLRRRIAPDGGSLIICGRRTGVSAPRTFAASRSTTVPLKKSGFVELHIRAALVNVKSRNSSSPFRPVVARLPESPQGRRILMDRPRQTATAFLQRRAPALRSRASRNRAGRPWTRNASATGSQSRRTICCISITGSPQTKATRIWKILMISAIFYRHLRHKG